MRVHLAALACLSLLIGPVLFADNSKDDSTGETVTVVMTECSPSGREPGLKVGDELTLSGLGAFELTLTWPNGVTRQVFKKWKDFSDPMIYQSIDRFAYVHTLYVEKDHRRFVYTIIGNGSDTDKSKPIRVEINRGVFK